MAPFDEDNSKSSQAYPSRALRSQASVAPPVPFEAHSESQFGALLEVRSAVPFGALLGVYFGVPLGASSAASAKRTPASTLNKKKYPSIATV
ncbi:hypothetical protein GUJ93_ZPchr0004g38237 [Zizania palustris]|uniref:Uncharacterized protein n=1 Tax=Zizania palustris TaxID=103762 RepID=A0A8J5SYN2_ZIZPA|nr:hypothetical protein GUJ93_ZPchr0004g38237 [Zizania palustris]